MAVMLHSDPTHIFTIDEFVARLTKVKPDAPEWEKSWDFIKTLQRRQLKPKRNTIWQYLKRFGAKGIAERVSLPNDGIGYRCASVHKTLAYIEGRSEEYDEKLTPKAQPTLEATDIVHRNGYRLRLPKRAFESIKVIGEYHKHGRSPSHYRLDNEVFSLEAYPPKGNSFIWLKGNWEPEVNRLFGAGTVVAVKAGIEAGGLIGVAKDFPWKELYARPIQIINDKGQVALYRVARSQKKDGEIDIHRYDNDEMAKQFENWWDDKHFKADMLKATKRAQTFQDRTFEVFNLITHRLEALEQNQLRIMQLIDKNLNGKKPEPDQQPYQAPSEDKGDMAYR